jgi:hypothetical protein
MPLAERDWRLSSPPGPEEGQGYTRIASSLRGRFPLFPESLVFFYELHEGDDDLFSDLLLAREEEMDPELFFDTVQSIRHRVQDTFEHDTLIEAIAEVLERDYGFIFVSDDRLTAAVNVSKAEDENFLADLEGAESGEEDELGADYRAIVADFRGDPRRPN